MDEIKKKGKSISTRAKTKECSEVCNISMDKTQAQNLAKIKDIVSARKGKT